MVVITVCLEAWPCALSAVLCTRLAEQGASRPFSLPRLAAGILGLQIHAALSGFFTWVPGIEHRSSGLPSKGLFPLGHLAGPTTSFLETGCLTEIGTLIWLGSTIYLSSVSPIVLVSCISLSRFPGPGVEHMHFHNQICTRLLEI